MGFCLDHRHRGGWAQAELGFERVAIVDWDVHHGELNAGHRGRRPDDLLRVAAPVAVLPGHRRPAGRDARQPAACRRHRRRGLRRSIRDGRARSPAVRARTAARHRRRTCGSQRPGSPSWRGALVRWRRASPPCSRAATTSRRCPTSSGAALEDRQLPLDRGSAQPTAAARRRWRRRTTFVSFGARRMSRASAAEGRECHRMTHSRCRRAWSLGRPRRGRTEQTRRGGRPSATAGELLERFADATRRRASRAGSSRAQRAGAGV